MPRIKVPVPFRKIAAGHFNTNPMACFKNNAGSSQVDRVLIDFAWNYRFGFPLRFAVTGSNDAIYRL